MSRKGHNVSRINREVDHEGGQAMPKPTCQAGCCGGDNPGIPTQLRPHTEPIDALTPYHRNPRRGDTTLIAASLTRNGQYRPIVANTGTLTGRPREVLAGNHTLAAARELGWAHVAATWVDVNDDHAARIVAVDNRSNDVAGYDDETLLALLADLPDLDGTGYDEDFLRDLEATLEPFAGGGLTDPDDVPDTPDADDAVTRAGDVWILGGHRLVCGDCREPAVAAAFGPGDIGLTLTDPPYGVSERTDRNAKGRGNLAESIDFVPVHDDDKPFDPSHLVTAHDRLVLFGANYYAEHLPPSPSWIVWDKLDGLTTDKRDVGFDDNADAELAWTNLGGPARIIAHRWKGLLKATEKTERRVHPTQKPVELMVRIIEWRTGRGDIVHDPYAGSGSVLIACEATGRTCWATEIEPAYCDVIARRWQEHTGKVPVLRRDGHPDVGYDMTTGQPVDPAGVDAPPVGV